MLRQITDELMFEIRELTGQEYRNVYAGSADTEPAPSSRIGTVMDVPVAREMATVGS